MRALIGDPAFHAGLWAGLVGLAVAAVAVAIWSVGRSGRPREARMPPGVLGPVLVLATVVGIGGVGPFTQVWPVPARVAVGLAVLWGAGEISRPGSPRFGIGTALALVGGILLVDPRADFPVWVITLLVVGPAVGGAAAAALDRRGARSGTGPLLFGLAVIGLFVTVPDTELALVLVGATIPLTVLAWPRAWARLGGGGAYALIGLFLWVATLEGAGRPGSIVGATAALGVLVAEPAGRTLAHHARRARGRRSVRQPPARIPSTGTLVAAQVLAAAWAGRVAGMVAAPFVALVLAVPGVVLALVATTWYRPTDPGAPTAGSHDRDHRSARPHRSRRSSRRGRSRGSSSARRSRRSSGARTEASSDPRRRRRRRH